MNRMPQVQVANLGNALSQGMAIGQNASNMRTQNLLAQALPQAIQGDQNALQKVMQLDPATGMQVQQHAAKQGQERLKQAQQEGMYVVQSLSAMPEGERAQMYPRVVGQFRQRFPELAQIVPEQYDPQWFRMAQSRFLPGAGEALTEQAFPKPQNPAKPTSTMQEYELAKSQGFKGSFMDYKAAGKGNGISFTSPDGTQIQIGGQVGSFGKPAQNQIEGSFIDAVSGLDRLRSVQRSFKPEYLTIGGKIKNWTAGLKDKAGIDLNEQEKAYLTDYSDFASKTRDNLNRYIKEITGAAMSQAEAMRIQGTVPNEKDSPTQFKSKMDSVMQQLTRAAARAKYLQQTGMSMDAVPLSRMDKIIDQYGEQVESRIRQSQPDLDDSEIEALALQQVRRYFGM